MTIGFAVQAHPTADPAEWVALARTAEDAGFEAIVVADHPGSTAAPLVALAALAPATTRILLGTAVLNAGAWQPLALAAEIATLDVLSEGRALFGAGAGHTPAEWTMTGRPYPRPAQRVAHLVELVDATRKLLAGETVDLRGRTVRLEEARLAWPDPPRPAVPLLVGGYGRRLIAYGARAADIVELVGLGRTLPDGHLHEPQWSAASLDGRLEVVRRAAGRRVPRLGVLVQKVEVTPDRRAAAAAWRDQLGKVIPESALPTLEQVLEVPYALIGTEDEIVQQLRRHQQRWGIERYTVRSDVLAPVAGIIERLFV